MQMSHKSVTDLARSAIAMGTVIEAHADERDVVRKVIVSLPEWVQNDLVKARVSGLWQERGFIANINQEGLLVIDGFAQGGDYVH